jgi:hypothetical protein
LISALLAVPASALLAVAALVHCLLTVAAHCCINCLLIVAHCSLQRLTMNPYESVGSTAAPVNVDDYDLMADPK